MYLTENDIVLHSTFYVFLGDALEIDEEESVDQIIGN
jgi:hypothetical protein